MLLCMCYTLSSLEEECMSKTYIYSKMNSVEIKWERRAPAPLWLAIVHPSLTLPCPKGFNNEQNDSAVLVDFYCVQGVHNLLAGVTAIQ